MAKFNSMLRNIDLALNFIVAFTTSASVASWVIWKDLHVLWIAIVGAAQFVVATKPFYPYLRDQKRMVELQLLHNRFSFDYENLWRKSAEDAENAKIEFDKLRETHFKLFEHFQDVNVLEIERWRASARKERNAYLKINYEITI